MSRNGDTYFLICLFLDLLCQLVSDRRIFSLGQLLFILFLGQFRIFLGDCALGNRKDRERLARFAASVDHFLYRFDIVWNLRKQDNVRAACDTCVKGNMSHFMSHNLDNKYTAV